MTNKNKNKRQALNQTLSPSPTHTPLLPSPLSPTMESAMAAMNSKLDMLCGSIQQIKEIDIAVKSLVRDNETMKAEIAKRDTKIQQLTDQVNRMDQASRSSSLRILGLNVTTQTPTPQLVETVYNEILVPILEAAKTNGDLPPQTVLPPHFLIVNVFAIPAKKASQSCPVILKLNSELIRSLVFKYKKNSLPTATDLSSNRVRNKYSIFEDLAPATHAVFRTFSEDIRVKSAWSFCGQIRFKTHDSETVHKVKTLTDTFESIVG